MWQCFILRREHLCQWWNGVELAICKCNGPCITIPASVRLLFLYNHELWGSDWKPYFLVDNGKWETTGLGQEACLGHLYVNPSHYDFIVIAWMNTWKYACTHVQISRCKSQGANLKVQQQANWEFFFLEVVSYLVTGTSNCSCKTEVGLLIHFHTNTIKKTLVIVSNHLIILCQLHSFLYHLMLWRFRGHWLCGITIIPSACN